MCKIIENLLLLIVEYSFWSYNINQSFSTMFKMFLALVSADSFTIVFGKTTTIASYYLGFLYALSSFTRITDFRLGLDQDTD